MARGGRGSTVHMGTGGPWKDPITGVGGAGCGGLWGLGGQPWFSGFMPLIPYGGLS